MNALAILPEKKQGDYLSGKPSKTGNVRKFIICSEKKKSGN